MFKTSHREGNVGRGNVIEMAPLSDGRHSITINPTNLVQPRLCFVGPMIGGNGKGKAVTTPGLILAKLFSDAGYETSRTSTVQNRYLRFADIVRTLLANMSLIDVIVLDVFGGPSFVVEDTVSRLGQLFGKPVVMFLHGGSMPEFMSSYPAWTQKVLGRADLLVSPSKYLAKAVLEHGFKARVIPNVVNITHYPYRHRSSIQPKMFWMRTFHPLYHPQMAVKVLAAVKKTYPGATLVMAGEEKGLLAETRSLAQQLGVESSIEFPGFLNLEGKLKYGEAADIYLNTNRVDNMPVGLLEAAAFGLPVVATQVGGIADLVQHEHSALLVPDENCEAMAAAVCRLVAEPDLTSRLSSNGRILAESCSWERVRTQWEEAFAMLPGRDGKGK